MTTNKKIANIIVLMLAPLAAMAAAPKMAHACYGCTQGLLPHCYFESPDGAQGCYTIATQCELTGGSCIGVAPGGDE